MTSRDLIFPLNHVLNTHYIDPSNPFRMLRSCNCRDGFFLPGKTERYVSPSYPIRIPHLRNFPRKETSRSLIFPFLYTNLSFRGSVGIPSGVSMSTFR